MHIIFDKSIGNMINPFMHCNQVNLTGIVEITAEIIKLILNENNETTIADIKD